MSNLHNYYRLSLKAGPLSKNYLIIFLFCGLYGLSIPFYGQSIRVSDQTQIRIMTMEPYQGELYSAFGHSAIRIVDPLLGVDLVYNYGIFDFNQENFYWNFIQGILNYKLGATYYEPFIQHYIAEDRTIVEQTLNLKPEEVQAVVDYLAVNHLPENRVYRYNYVYENCATKLRDLIEEVFPERVHFNYPYVQEPKSFRQLMDDYLGQQAWGDLGIDIGLGMQIDHEVGGYEYMFLPDYVEQAFDVAVLEREGEMHPLVSEKIYTYRSEEKEDASALIKPWMLFGALLLFGILGSYFQVKGSFNLKFLDIILFSVVNLVGFLLVFLWFFTEHLSEWNLNLLWAWPFHFVLLVLKPKGKMLYYLIYAVVLGLLLLSWAWLPQELHGSLIFLVLLLLLRSAYQYHAVKKISSNL